ncbi:MAG TPA: hypothetical protein PLI47_06285 [Bacteroidia bacterium]|nr:hypothetical protein [Bacteroidota bacterium]MBP9790517.1 hypothetical protein [Bacteroidia bacterium]MBK7429449.1 hypothetical protein [Bacteroidota bacterium]MBK7572492.1 hypothetical protein [Bacteroidota bacterium]MBP9923823.1 hypothetical protein [Bacteroidia bacterium]
MTRQLLYIYFLIAISVNCIAQNCSCISGTKKKKDSTKTWGGITSSKDFYSLLINRVVNYEDTTIASKYYLSLSAASRVLLSDSITKSKGSFELLLADSSKVTFEGAECLNNPAGFAGAIGFQILLTEEQIKIISTNPIVTLTAFGILRTSFDPQKQNEQKRIVTCLLKAK